MTIGWKSPITKNVTTAIIKPEKFMTNRAIEVLFHLFYFHHSIYFFSKKNISTHKEPQRQREPERAPKGGFRWPHSQECRTRHRRDAARQRGR